MKVLTKLIVKHSNFFIKKISTKTIYRQIRKYNSFPPTHSKRQDLIKSCLLALEYPHEVWGEDGLLREGSLMVENLYRKTITL